MLKILFTGMPGAGKGTQAQLLTRFGLTHISTGEVIREAFKNNDPILMPFKESIEKGNLLPDKQIFQLLNKEIKKVKGKGYILDGAVRTLEQAKFALDKCLVDEVIHFTLPQDVALKRLFGRMKNAQIKRKDDAPEVFKKRFEDYIKKTKPLLSYLKDKVNFHEIDASPTVEEIHRAVKKVLGIK